MNGLKVLNVKSMNIFVFNLTKIWFNEITNLF